MATLAAHDQENAVRNISIGPGGKPLNAGVKGLGAKTPGNKAPKTPFKVPLNDENVFKQGGKSGKGKGGKSDENAFLTPAGPRTRAPLGMKTTNAKSNAFKTPAPISAKTQKVSPRLRRPKVKVHQPELDAESEDDVPDIEYMPPKEVPLADDMDDYLPKDWKFPMFEGKNMTRGIWEAYHNPIEDDGRPKKLREFEEGLARDKKKANAEFDKVFAAQMAKDDADMRRHMGIEAPKEAPKAAVTTAAPKRTTTGVSTLKARSAAHALSPVGKPSFAAPTAAAKPRALTGLVASKKSIKPLAEPSTARRAAAVAASNSTIGYAQGRAGRAAPAARKPLSNVTKPAPFSATSRRPTASSAVPDRSNPTSAVRSRSAFSRSSSAATDATLVQEEQPYRTAEDVERELELMLLSRSDDKDDDAWSNSFNNQLHAGPLEEELEDFQFTLPEGF
ncbi:hypothetical protein CC86DRAFT_365974 [Ophiobolus disseminans]|uniref:Uncharacterized protein n=1 Tax=Ophiobolus disseminans TaxID=1469910 RepID=A0A6A7AFH5_9PLEO|nr:hypothetical protein CC86DRAFT_365974 [Ophiobolus disseminans]